jgi:hypothetical protein
MRQESLLRPPTVRVVLRAIYFDDCSTKASAWSHRGTEAGQESPSRAGVERSAHSHLLDGVCAGILAAGRRHGNGGDFCVLRVAFPLANLDRAGANVATDCLSAEPLRPWPGFAPATAPMCRPPSRLPRIISPRWRRPFSVIPWEMVCNARWHRMRSACGMDPACQTWAPPRPSLERCRFCTSTHLAQLIRRWRTGIRRPPILPPRRSAWQSQELRDLMVRERVFGSSGRTRTYNPSVNSRTYSQ